MIDMLGDLLLTSCLVFFLGGTVLLACLPLEVYAGLHGGQDVWNLLGRCRTVHELTEIGLSWLLATEGSWDLTLFTSHKHHKVP